tara:strand:- start:4664 stop:5101 length:438 start_codon:yes stop_codon:yes gene_type:complete
MKKLILLLTLLLVTSCATANNTPKEDPYATLTVEKVTKYCQPRDLWNVGVLGNPAMIATFQNCLEIEELLIIIAPADKDNKELGIAIIKVVQLSYVGYLRGANEDKSYEVKLLKSMYRALEEEGDAEKAKSHVYFYSLESTKKSN